MDKEQMIVKIDKILSELGNFTDIEKNLEVAKNLHMLKSTHEQLFAENMINSKYWPDVKKKLPIITMSTEALKHFARQTPGIDKYASNHCPNKADKPKLVEMEKT
jgi:flagellin-specific chaperone FliS